MKILIIGLGSIGKKHISVLTELYPNANVFALRSKSSFNEIQNDLEILLTSLVLLVYF